MQLNLAAGDSLNSSYYPLHVALQSAHVEVALQPGVRATLEMGPEPRAKRLPAGPLGSPAAVLDGRLALPSAPRAKLGAYWGYTVRIARGLSAAVSECPFQV